MKTMQTTVGVILLALAVGAGVAFSQGEEPKDDPAKKIEVLETDLVVMRERNDALGAELATTKATLARVVSYLEAQASSAAALAEVLDQSEQAGFTAGINPRSREVLLGGWREHLATLQADVPVMPVAAKAGEVKAGENPAPR